MNDGSDMNGKPRRYGFLSPNGPSHPGLKYFSESMKPRLAECGIAPEAGADRTYAFVNGFWVAPAAEEEATQNVAAFRRADVTTVLWLGGSQINHTHRMGQAQYYPEIVFAGALEQDDNAEARFMDPQVWRNAWGTTLQLRVDRLENSWGFRACMEGDPSLTRGKCDLARNFYTAHFMVFRAIQAAGPRLNPTAVDRGLHAFPRSSSKSPYVAACFFDPGDYTCVKDSAELWWDPTGQSPTNTAKGVLSLDEWRP